MQFTGKPANPNPNLIAVSSTPLANESNQRRFRKLVFRSLEDEKQARSRFQGIIALFLMLKNMESLNRIDRNMGCASPITNGRETQKERSGAQVVTRLNRKLRFFSAIMHGPSLINQLRACDSCCVSSEPVCKKNFTLLGPPRSYESFYD
jgi:hypothetical protein